MSFKLKPITETSWLVLGETDDLRVGLLTEVRNQYTLIAAGAKKQFLDRMAVNKYFNEDVFTGIVEEKVAVEAPKDYFINGYPVDFESPNEVLLSGCSLPLFSKKATSDVYYSAGYYCLNFPKNWMPAMSPKLTTLNTYEYAGPFTTELEMRTALAKLRKEKNALK